MTTTQTKRPTAQCPLCHRTFEIRSRTKPAKYCRRACARRAQYLISVGKNPVDPGYSPTPVQSRGLVTLLKQVKRIHAYTVKNEYWEEAHDLEDAVKALDKALKKRNKRIREAKEAAAL